MSLDLTTLQLLKHRDRYDRLRKAVPDRALDTRTRIILADFGRFFHDFLTRRASTVVHSMSSSAASTRP